MLKNSKMNYEEQEMMSQLNKRVTIDVAGSAVMRWNFDRGKIQTGLLEPEGSLSQEG